MHPGSQENDSHGERYGDCPSDALSGPRNSAQMSNGTAQATVDSEFSQDFMDAWNASHRDVSESSGVDKSLNKTGERLFMRDSHRFSRLISSRGCCRYHSGRSGDV